MKTFKFYLAALAIALSAGFTSCSSEYDDSEIWDKVNDLLNRVQKLEASVQQQNANITALQTMLDAIKDNVYVTSVEELEEGKGYSLKFSNGEEVNIYHGEKGDQGVSPSISIIKEGDNYYWSVNGEVLKDDEGNKIPADGGATDVLPQLKTGSQLEADGVAGTWEKDAVYVSVDNVKWSKVVAGESTQIFVEVEIVENNQTVIITLADGSTIILPKTEKILALLYGTWKKQEKWDLEGDILLSFGKDNAFSYEFTSDIYANENESWTGKFRFIPDRYIQCTGVTDEGEGFDFVFNIVEITETTLTINGSDLWEGSFTRAK